MAELSSYLLTFNLKKTTYEPFTPNYSEQRSPLSYYRGCWHEISRDLFLWYSHALLKEKGFTTYSLHHPRGVAGSDFRPLSKIPHCCLRTKSGPCLSSSVADHPRRPTKDLRLGRLLLYQLPNPPSTHPKAQILSEKLLYIRFLKYNRIICGIKPKKGLLFPTIRVDLKVLLTRSPRI